MARKRKQRSSEPTVTETPDPQPQQEEEIPPAGEEEEEEEEEEQVEEVEEETVVEEEVEEEEEEEVEHEQEEEQEQEQEHNEQQQPETLISSGSEPQANGGGDKGNGSEEKMEEEEDFLDDEPLEKLLEPFGKEQLVGLLRKLVDKNPDVMGCVREFADADPAHRKIFVHGLGWDTTAETLKAEFGKFGEIEDCKAVTDRVSGKSKGYAFILYKHRVGARKALEQPQKKIGNRLTSCQLATTGPAPPPTPTTSTPGVSEYTQRKIFVSNVSADIDPEKLLQFFKQFGEIEEGPLGLDRNTGKPKGFALFVYKSVESAKRALEEPYKKFEEYTLHCQKAIDGLKYGKPGYGNAGGSGGHHHHHQQQQQHQHHHHQPHYQHSAKKGKFNSSAAGGPGHLMAPSGSSVGFNPGMAAQGLNPALGQALTALIATQGAGLGIGNLLGAFGGGAVNQGVPSVGYGNQGGAAYGNQPPMQGGYVNPQMNPQMGQGGAGRSQQGGPYMGH